MVRRDWAFVFISLFVFLFDRITKVVVIGFGSNIAVIKNVFHITLVKNFGVGFGLFKNQSFLIIAVSLFVLSGILYYYKQIPEVKYVQVAVALVLGGTFGNLYDRLMFGYVIDFIDFRIWPVFNIADISLVIGVFLLIYYFWNEDE